MEPPAHKTHSTLFPMRVPRSIRTLRYFSHTSRRIPSISSSSHLCDTFLSLHTSRSRHSLCPSSGHDNDNIKSIRFCSTSTLYRPSRVERLSLDNPTDPLVVDLAPSETSNDSQATTVTKKKDGELLRPASTTLSHHVSDSILFHSYGTMSNQATNVVQFRNLSNEIPSTEIKSELLNLIETFCPSAKASILNEEVGKTGRGHLQISFQFSSASLARHVAEMISGRMLGGRILITDTRMITYTTDGSQESNINKTPFSTLHSIPKKSKNALMKFVTLMKQGNTKDVFKLITLIHKECHKLASKETDDDTETVEDAAFLIFLRDVSDMVLFAGHASGVYLDHAINIKNHIQEWAQTKSSLNVTQKEELNKYLFSHLIFSHIFSSHLISSHLIFSHLISL